MSRQVHPLHGPIFQKEKSYKNRGLFSEHYLEHRLTDSRQNPEWLEDIRDPYKAFLYLYEEKKDIPDGLNEAQTESEILEPALRILGFSFVKQAKTDMGNRQDFALLVDESTKNAALASQKDPPETYAASSTSSLD